MKGKKKRSLSQPRKRELNFKGAGNKERKVELEREKKPSRLESGRGSTREGICCRGTYEREVEEVEKSGKDTSAFVEEEAKKHYFFFWGSAFLKNRGWNKLGENRKK